jgi:hypothetical protein
LRKGSRTFSTRCSEKTWRVYQLPSAGEFAQVWDAISKLNLADPKAEVDLEAKADYLERPGAASFAMELAKMMRDLAFRLRGLELYKEMAAPRPGS